MNLPGLNEFDECMIMYVIESVKQNSYIWDFQDPLNKSKIRKKRFWVDLAFELNHKFNPNVEVKFGVASRVWNALRSRFVIHYKRKLSNSGHITSWRYYKPLEFLIPRIKLQIISQKSIKIKRKNKFYKDVIPFSDKSSVTDSLSANSLNECDNSKFSLATDRKRIDYNNQNTLFSQSYTESPVEYTNQNAEFRVDDSNDTSMSKQFTIKKENEASYMLVIPMQDKTIADESSANAQNPITDDQQQIDDNTHYTVVNKSSAESLVEVNTNQIAERRIDNPNSAFGVYVTSEITQLDTDLQIRAKNQINTILIELLKEQLRRRLSTM